MYYSNATDDSTPYVFQIIFKAPLKPLTTPDSVAIALTTSIILFLFLFIQAILVFGQGLKKIHIRKKVRNQIQHGIYLVVHPLFIFNKHKANYSL